MGRGHAHLHNLARHGGVDGHLLEGAAGHRHLVGALRGELRSVAYLGMEWATVGETACACTAASAR